MSTNCCYGPGGCYGVQGYYANKLEYATTHTGDLAGKGAFCYIHGNLLFDRTIHWDEAIDNSKWYQEFHKNHKVLAVIFSVPLSVVRFVATRALAPVISAVCTVAFPLIYACGTAKRAYIYAAGWALWETAKYGALFVIFYYMVPLNVSLYILAASYGLSLVGEIFKGMMDPTTRRRDYLFQATLNSGGDTTKCTTVLCPNLVKKVNKQMAKCNAEVGDMAVGAAGAAAAAAAHGAPHNNLRF
jgi:hypothetical protein